MRTGRGADRKPDARRPLSRVIRASLPALVAGAALLTAAAPAAGWVGPLRIDSHRSLAAQFGYRPAYECNLPSFDARNRPVIRSRTASQDETEYAFAMDRGRFRRSSLLDALRRAYPGFRRTVNAGGWAGESIESDARGRLYTLIQIERSDRTLRNVLLYSVDRGARWRLVTLPGAPPRRSADGRNDGTCATEHLVGWDLRDEPPLVAFWRPVADWPGERAALMELYVSQPRFDGDRLVLGDPVLVTDRSLGLIQAAGGASFAATVGTTTWITYAEVAPSGEGACPTYVVAYDQTTGTLGEPQLVARARPPNDDHTTPGIVADGSGVLHVLSGGHNTPFMYAHTAASVETTGTATLPDWSRPEPILRSGFVTPNTDADGSGRQTYVSLVCLPDDTLVVAFRQWRAGVDAAFRGDPYDVLCVQWLRPGEEWSDPLRVAYSTTHAGYCQYYQKLTVDRLGRLYLSFNYFKPQDWPRRHRAENRYHLRMILTSADGGRSWRFATLADFRDGVLPE